MRLSWIWIGAVALAGCEAQPRFTQDRGGEVDEVEADEAPALSQRELYEYASRKQGHMGGDEAPADPLERWLEQARAALQRGDLQRACHAAKTAEGLAPKHPEPPLLLARCASRKGAHEAALKHYTRLLELQPGDLEGLYGQAMSLTLLERAAQATPLLLKLHARLKDPKLELPKARRARIHKLLGAAFAQRGDLTKAQAAYEALVGLDPEDLEGQRGLGEILFQRGDKAEAREVLSKIAARLADDALFNLQLGTLNAELGDFKEAARLLALSARLAPGDGRAWRNLAGAYERLGDAEAAAKAWEGLRRNVKGADPRGAIFERIIKLREGGVAAPQQ